MNRNYIEQELHEQERHEQDRKIIQNQIQIVCLHFYFQNGDSPSCIQGRNTYFIFKFKTQKRYLFQIELSHEKGVSSQQTNYNFLE